MIVYVLMSISIIATYNLSTLKAFCLRQVFLFLCLFFWGSGYLLASENVTDSGLSSRRLSAVELTLLSSLSLARLQALPANPSNRFSNQAKAKKLGEKLFFDQRLSGNGKLSCGSCHLPSLGFTDGKEKAQGMHKTGRNTQTLLGVAWQRWFYWDGRRDSLWAQALVPFEAADEMGASRVHVLRTIVEDTRLKQEFEAIFGPLNFEGLDIVAIHAGPWGDSRTQKEWFLLNRQEREQINQDYANVGKAVEAYVRTIVPKQSRFDRFIECESSPDKTCSNEAHRSVSEDEVAGMKLFVHPTKTRCLQCHNGPMLTNGSFHNIGSAIPLNSSMGADLDFGRVLGVRGVKLDEFNCIGPYSDAEPEACMALRFLNQSGHVPLQGAFKTPTLRALTLTGPYFHDGRFSRLSEVIDHYRQPPEGRHELVGADLSDEEAKQLVAFLNMLSPDSLE